MEKFKFSCATSMVFNGIKSDLTWNGWQCPLFELDEAKKIIEHFNYQQKTFGGEYYEQFTYLELEDAVLSQKSLRFLKNLAFILLFSGLVSAFTSYLVATQFPRYVRVDAPNNLSIIDSKVQVWEAKSPNTKEPQTNKQKESK